ncbi:arylsulfatase [Pseudomonas duriflava]|uniref:Arylsulfatase n=1 Tax=Pseudomonas duriflava TaxID=459528 RepID=A0A562Q7L0_9PSED|nr:arylsulfatase [Pseudomonas duriflava]TWI52694.1 arylsulfatase [Pseudomonas duriflava]
MKALPKLIAASICFSLSLIAAAETPPRHQPNILLLVADDLGYSDLGAMGSEINTPNLDKLIAEGRLLLDFHSAPSCSPTRAMLMTGNDQHLSGIGMMVETRDRMFANQTIRPGYEGTLQGEAVTLAELLRDAGYKTFIAGKWHLGKLPEQQPQNRGFEESYVVLEGGAANFKQTEMAIMPNYSATFVHNGQPLSLPDTYYSTTYFTDRLIDATRAAHQENKPFFAFAAYTSPHWPLQAPDDYLKKYKGRYDQGYEVIAEERLAKQKKLGLLPADFEGKAVFENVPAWNTLSDEEKRRSARTMEAYAAMVDSLDHEIGRLLEHLKETGEYDNTLILFMSDNGPEAVSREKAVSAWVEKQNFDNSLENIGRPNSFVTYGPAWAQVSAQPGRRYKQTIFEGGIRVPAFVHFPARIAKGVSREFASARDVMPTFLELAGVEHPGIRYQNRAVVPPQGSSMLPYLSGVEPRIHGSSRAMGWEQDGSAALRRGNLKLVYAPKATGKQWRLYDLSVDPSEQNDLAPQRPDQVKDLLMDWRQYAQSNNISVDKHGVPHFPALVRSADKAPAL